MEPASALSGIEGIGAAHGEKLCRGGIGTILCCSGMPIRVALASSAEHREDDLLGVSSLGEKTADATLVSLLKDYVLGEVIIHTYRLLQAAIAEPPELGDTFVHRGCHFITRRNRVGEVSN
jgi:hypothetical protein